MYSLRDNMGGGMMKKLMKNTQLRVSIIIISILMVITIKVNAQQEPMFTQYMFNSTTLNPANIGINPAFTGANDNLFINSLTRLQWVGMEGSPKTFSLTAHSAIPDKNMGVGITLVSDKAGPINNTFFTVNYAYRVNVFEDLVLSMGIKGGINSYKANLKDLEIIDEGDQQFDENSSKISPNLGFGFYLYNDQYYVGFSAPKLIQSTIDDQYATDDSQLKRHYFIVGGYNWQINKDWMLKPSLLTKIVEGSPVSNDITVQSVYQNWVGGGLVYRVGDALGLFVFGKVYDEINVGYGYEYSLNGLSGVNSGTHEILLTYNFPLFKSNERKKWKIFNF